MARRAHVYVAERHEPHRLSWGFAYNMPFAQVVGLVTLFGMLGTRDPKHMPWTPVTVMLLVSCSG